MKLGKNQKKILELLQTNREGMSYRDLSQKIFESTDFHSVQNTRNLATKLRKKGYPIYLLEDKGLVVVAETNKEFKQVHERWSDLLESRHESYSRLIAQVYEKQPSMIPEIKLRLNQLQRALLNYEDENYRQQLISAPNETVTASDK